MGQRPDVGGRKTAARDVLTRPAGAFSLDARLSGDSRVEVVNKLKQQLPGVADAHVDIVWDPP